MKVSRHYFCPHFFISVPDEDLRKQNLKYDSSPSSHSSCSDIKMAQQCQILSEKNTETVQMKFLPIQGSEVANEENLEVTVTTPLNPVSDVSLTIEAARRGDSISLEKSSAFPSSTWVQFCVLLHRTLLTIVRDMVS